MSLLVCEESQGDGGDFTALTTASQRPAALCWFLQLLVSVQFLHLDLFDEIIPEEDVLSSKFSPDVFALMPELFLT